MSSPLIWNGLYAKALTSDILINNSSFQNLLVGTQFAHNSSSAVISGGVISVNGGDNTKFDVSAGTGQIITYSTPTAPTITSVSWSAFTAQTVTGLATQDETYILITGAGAIMQLSNFPTPTQRRANIFLGRLGTSSRTFINFANPMPDLSQSLGNQLFDLHDALGPFNISGNTISNNGAVLSFQKAAGKMFFRGFNYAIDPTTPSYITSAAATPQSFFYRTQTTLDSTSRTLVIPGTYDVGGTATAVPGGAGTATIQRVYLSPNGTVQIQYGQATYGTLTAAVAAVGTELFVVNPGIANTGILIAYIAVTKGCTALNDTANCSILRAPRFETGVGGGVNNVTNLQQTYNSSVAPQIVLNATGGGLRINDNSTPIGGTLFQIANNSGSTNYLSLDSDSLDTQLPFILANATASTNAATGALVVTGGAGIGGKLWVGDEGHFLNGLYVNSGTSNLTTDTTFSSSTASTNSGTGAVVLTNGGLGVKGRINSDGAILTANATAAVSTSTGALIAVGGAGIGGALYAGGVINAQSATASTNATTGSVVTTGGLGVGGAINSAGAIKTIDTTASTTAATGSIIAAGGLGVGGAVNTGGVIRSSDVTNSTSTATGAIIAPFGGIGVGANITAGGVIRTNSLTGSTSPATGALLVAGGAGITENLYIGGVLNVAGTFVLGGNFNPAGIVHITNTTDSTSYVDGALIVDGGVGIAKTLNVAGIIKTTNATASTGYTTGALVVGGGAGIAGTLNVHGTSQLEGATHVFSSTNSTNSSTGALIVDGGLGVGININAGGAIKTVDTTSSVSTTTGSIIAGGGVGIAQNLNVGGATNITGATVISSAAASTSPNTGALIVTGGVGVSGAINGGSSVSLTEVASISNPSAGRLAIYAKTDEKLYVKKSDGSEISVGGSTLQAAYDGGSTAVLTSGSGTFLIKDNATPIGVALFQVTDNAGASFKLSVTSATVTTNIPISITDATVSSSTVTGALKVTGGVGIGGALNVGGALTIGILNLTQQASTPPGTGGVNKIYAKTDGQLYWLDGSTERGIASGANPVVLTNATDSTTVSTGALIVSGGVGITKKLTIGDQITSTSGNDSSVYTNGALVMSGGIGIAGTMNANGGIRANQYLVAGTTISAQGDIFANSTDDSTSATTGALQVAGGVGIAKKLFVAGAANIGGITTLSSNTTSTAFNNGTLVVTGGVGISENLNMGGGTLTVNGTLKHTNITLDRAMYVSSAAVVSSSPTTSTQLGYLSTTNSDVQGQIDRKAPGRNYISDPLFEDGDTNFWSLGTTGTLTAGVPTGTPTFGTGASANLTIAYSNVSPLEGTGSLRYQHVTNQTVAGNMMASSVINIDRVDRNKWLSVKFVYDVSVGAANVNASGTTSNSFAWAVRDITNSVWLTCSNRFGMNTTAQTTTVTGTVKLGPTTQQLRFVFYNANATANVSGGGAATVFLDDFFLGAVPQDMTEPVSMSYTTTAGTSCTAATQTTIPFSSKIYDTHNAYNTTTGVYTCPNDGKFLFTANLLMAAATYSTTQSLELVLLKNGTQVASLTRVFGGGASINIAACATAVVSVLAGDTLALAVFSSVTNTVFTTANYSLLTITRVSD